MSAISTFRDSQKIEKQRSFWTELKLKEDKFVLYAFSDEGRRDLFNELCQIKGVGTSTALLVLELGEMRDILRAISSDDEQFFMGIPGLGKVRISAIMRLGRNRHLPPPTDIPISLWVEIRERHGTEKVDELLEASTYSDDLAREVEAKLKPSS